MRMLDKMLALTWHLKERKKVIIRKQKDMGYTWKTLYRDEKPRCEKEWNVLALLRLYYVWKDVFLPIFSTSYPFLQISTWVLASQYRCMCLTIQMHVPLIIWGIWLSKKTGVKSSFFYFGPFHSCDVICWPKDRNCANVALEPMGRWPYHCLGNKS